MVNWCRKMSETCINQRLPWGPHLVGRLKRISQIYARTLGLSGEDNGNEIEPGTMVLISGYFWVPINLKWRYPQIDGL